MFSLSKHINASETLRLTFAVKGQPQSLLKFQSLTVKCFIGIRFIQKMFGQRWKILNENLRLAPLEQALRKI